MKKIAAVLAVTAAIMLLLPWLAVTFVKGDNSMAVCFILFFGIDPLYSLISGALAGQNVKQLWCLTIFPPLLFLAGVWIFFGMGETAFVLYAAVYLVIGLLAMTASMLINKKIRQ